MQHLGARASDWHSGNPRIRTGAWVGVFLGVLVLYIAATALVGSFVNGDGSPYLSSAATSGKPHGA
jgi:hypothetical protein